ncbi:MauE/DoxX family redox-associated membrane protein [Daejeonella sp.]|uniref:MauE/DoxX family redox-associated membrane protein n=1 Tax=Daejeonella sp. TaxID=2805397 RepID=UPI0030BA8353
MKKSSTILISSIALVILWTYAATSKLADFRNFKTQMRKQVFSDEIADILVYLVPITEIVVALLLCLSLTRFYGFVFSAILLLSFSIYIALILAGLSGKVPCSCGGVLSQLGWGEHLAFNLCFLALALSGIFLSQKKGGLMTK